MTKEFCGNGGKACPKFCMLAVKVKRMYVQQINDVNDSRGKDLNIVRQKRKSVLGSVVWCAVNKRVPGSCLEDVL